MSEQWDVIVVGGGPAGSATAARLAALGHRVLLMDRQRFPRPKPCGDCVSPAGVAELARLGALSRLEQSPSVAISGWTIATVHGVEFGGSFPEGRRGLAIDRERLDLALVEHAAAAGVEVETGVRVADVVRDRRGAVRGVELSSGERRRCRLLIGADGLRSVVVRRLGLVARRPELKKLALTGHVAGVEALGSRGELRLTRWGTVGLAPVGDGLANVTVVVSGAAVAGVAGAREAWYDSVVRQMPRLAAATRRGGVIATGPFDLPVRRAVVDGALLVGDAAGYYDPFTGQGIFRALRGAALAAEVADSALRTGKTGAEQLEPYERTRRRAFASGERLQWVIEQFTARPGLMRISAEIFRRRPALANTLVAVTGDLLPVRALWSPAMLAAPAG